MREGGFKFLFDWKKIGWGIQNFHFSENFENKNRTNIGISKKTLAGSNNEQVYFIRPK